MPLALTMYSVAGKLVVQIITLVLELVQSRIMKKPKSEVQNMQLKTLAISVILFILIILMGSFVTSSSNMENLAYSSSVYFWFISLSTIGYGDITFKRDQHLKSPHMMMVAVVTLLFGIGILAAIIAAISLVLEKRDLRMSTIIIDDDDDDRHAILGEEHDDFSSATIEDEGLDFRQKRDNYTKGCENLRKIFDDVDDDENTCITTLSSEESLNSVRNNRNNTTERSYKNGKLRNGANESETTLKNHVTLISNDEIKCNRSENRCNSSSFVHKDAENIPIFKTVRPSVRFTEDSLKLLSRKRTPIREKQETSKLPQPVAHNTKSPSMLMKNGLRNRSPSILDEPGYKNHGYVNKGLQ